MTIRERLKNIWTLGEYHVENGEAKVLKKMPTMKKKLATIVPERSQLQEGIIDEGGTIE